MKDLSHVYFLTSRDNIVKRQWDVFINTFSCKVSFHETYQCLAQQLQKNLQIPSLVLIGQGFDLSNEQTKCLLDKAKVLFLVDQSQINPKDSASDSQIFWTAHGLLTVDNHFGPQSRFLRLALLHELDLSKKVSPSDLFNWGYYQSSLTTPSPSQLIASTTHFCHLFSFSQDQKDKLIKFIHQVTDLQSIFIGRMKDIQCFCDGLSFALNLSFEVESMDLRSTRHLSRKLLDLKMANSWIHLGKNSECSITVFGNIGCNRKILAGPSLMITGLAQLAK